MWETHPSNYWVFSKMADFLSLIPWSFTFQDGGWPGQISHHGDLQDVKFPTQVCFTESNSHGLLAPTPPPPGILGQTIDRCIMCQYKLNLNY